MNQVIPENRALSKVVQGITYENPAQYHAALLAAAITATVLL